MRILILGAGRVGSTLAAHLISPENHITLVDKDEVQLNRIGNTLDVQPILGNASHPDVLEKAGAAQADIFIAVTDVDEINMIACEIVHALFDIDLKIARIRQQSYLLDPYRATLFQPQNLSIDFVISPEAEVARAMSRSIQIQGTATVIDVFDTLKLLSIRCLNFFPLVNTPLRLFPGLYPSLDIVLLAIQRSDQTFIPGANDTLIPDDWIHFLVPQHQISEAMAAFGYGDLVRRNVMLAGCGNIGLALAREIEKSLPDVQLKIIEKNVKSAELASRSLKRSEVLNGSALSADLLKEANSAECDTFISVTDDDNTNVLAALLAKDCGAKRAVSLLNETQNAKFFLSLGVDAIINQNSITVSAVLKAIHQHRVHSLHTLEGGLEIIEAPIEETSNILGMLVEDVTISGQVLVAALQRGEALHILPQKLMISAHDRLIFVTTKSTLHKVEKLVSSRFYDV
ncbi:Trk system potassium transport protein TrkA [Alphaproteobacteria bacterium]|nr:Trk system potassium transport protein TrkA [Alphaproteobacteria bacterium]GHS98174.1 Trk system potassium transport protein TrkA [Alphaproteobacteria bacterium]